MQQKSDIKTMLMLQRSLNVAAHQTVGVNRSDWGRAESGLNHRTTVVWSAVLARTCDHFQYYIYCIFHHVLAVHVVVQTVM